MISKARDAWVRLRRDRRGNAAMIFGLSAIPTFAFLGFAIDYGVALSDKAKLDAAADAAAMASLTAGKAVITAYTGSSSAATTAAVTAADAAAAAAFKGNAGALGFATAPAITTPTLTRNGQVLTSTVKYSSTPVKTGFSRMIGIPQININGTSSATLTLPTYINYYFIVDSSQSMGVGATPADMQTLYDRVIAANNFDNSDDKAANIGCVFGCHVPEAYQSISNEALAHMTYNGVGPVKLRIDSAKDAINAVLTDAQTANAAAGTPLIKVAVYTMQQNPQVQGCVLKDIPLQKDVSPNCAGPTLPATLQTPGSDFTILTYQVNKYLDLGDNNAGGTGDTSFANSLNYFATNILSAQGDGSSATSALNYVFLITDGLSDVPPVGAQSCISGHCTAAFNDTLCSALKTNATVGVIYTTYNPIYDRNTAPNLQGAYQALAAPYVPYIPGNLQHCTTDSTKWYYEASDGPGITTGMKKLFASTATQARLSQ
jgi:Flp pilus assembly protein TadG